MYVCCCTRVDVLSVARRCVICISRAILAFLSHLRVGATACHSVAHEQLVRMFVVLRFVVCSSGLRAVGRPHRPWLGLNQA